MPNNQLNTPIRNPIDLAKPNFDDFVDSNKNILSQVTFLSPIFLPKDKEFLEPSTGIGLFEHDSKLFKFSNKPKFYEFKLIANFKVKDTTTVNFIYNDKSNKATESNLKITLFNGKNELTVELGANEKSDVKKFQLLLNSKSNNFIINANDKEYKQFLNIVQKITKKTVKKYKNIGVIGDIEDKTYLLKNALIKNDEIYWDNENCEIVINDNEVITMVRNTHKLPELTKCETLPSTLAKDLLENIRDSFGENAVLAYLTIGTIIMSPYYEKFAKNIGFPTLILFGGTSTGKSTLVAIGISILGMSSDFMFSGGSTIKSNEHFASVFNGSHIATDDVKGITIQSDNFTS